MTRSEIMKAILIARVSAEEQKEAGNSLPAQISRPKNYCQRRSKEGLLRATTTDFTRQLEIRPLTLPFALD